MATRVLASALGSSLCVYVCVGCANENPVGVGGAGGSVTGVGSTSVSAAHTATSATGAAASAAATTNGSSSSGSSSSGSTTSTGSGPTCMDTGPGEPNDTIATAFALPAITDCNSDAAVLQGVLGENPNDVDWYKYDGSDTFGCVVDPTRQLTGQNIRICKYITCTNAAFTCPSGTQFDTQAGKPGCCWTGGQSVTVDLSCNTTNDSATVFMRIDHPGGPGCEPYQVDYHF